MSYHLIKIEKGTLGEFTKIREEFEELQDAVKQNNNILMICELADLTGAIKHFAQKWNLSIQDLLTMSDATARSFQSGERK